MCLSSKLFIIFLMKAFAKVQKQKTRSYQQERKIIEVIVKSVKEDPQLRKRAFKQPSPANLKQHVINYKVKSQLPTHTLEKRMPMPVTINRNKNSNGNGDGVINLKSEAGQQSIVQNYGQDRSDVQNYQKLGSSNTLKLNNQNEQNENQKNQQSKVQEYQSHNSQNDSRKILKQKQKGESIRFKTKPIKKIEEIQFISQNNVVFIEPEPVQLDGFQEIQTQTHTKPLQNKLKRSFKQAQQKWNPPGFKLQNIEVQNSIEMQCFQFDYRNPFSF